MTHQTIFIAFLFDNFSKSNSKLQKHSNFNIFPDFLIQVLENLVFSTRPKKISAPQVIPKTPLWLFGATIDNTADDIISVDRRRTAGLRSLPVLPEFFSQKSPI